MTCIARCLLCLAILGIIASPLSAAEPAAVDHAIREEQLAELQAKVKRIVEQYADWQAEGPFNELLKDLPADVQIQAMLPSIQIGATRNSAGQRAICKRLGEFGAASTQPLLKLLDEADSARRAAACFAITQMKFRNQSIRRLPWASDVGPKLAELLSKDASPLVRKEAARALGSLGEQGSPWVDAIIHAMHDDDKDVGSMAIGELEHIGPAGWRAVPALIEMLNTESDSAFYACRALKGMGYAARDAVPTLLQVLADPTRVKIHDEASYALMWIIERHVEPIDTKLLAAACRTNKNYVASDIALQLNPDSMDVAAALAQSLELTEAHIFGNTESTALALGKMKPTSEALIAYLLALAESDRPYARAWAALAYDKVTGDHQRAVKAMQRILESLAKDEENHAIPALGLIGPPAANLLPKLVPNKQASNPWLALNTIEAIWRIEGQPHAHLQFVADQVAPRTSNGYSWEARRVLSLLGPLADPAVPMLAPILDNYTAYADENRWNAVCVLRDIGPTQRTRALLPKLMEKLDPQQEPSPYNRRIIAEAVWSIGGDNDLAAGAIARTLDDGGRNFFWACWALQRMGPDAKAALPRLRQALNDDNPHFRHVAEQAIAAIDISPARPTDTQLDLWYEQLGDADAEVALQARGKLVRAGNPAVEYLAGKLGDKTADRGKSLQALIKQLNDEDWNQREAATRELAGTLPGSYAYLKKMLDKPLSAEAHHRLESLLNTVNALDRPAAADTFQWPYQTLELNRRFGRARQAIELLRQRSDVAE